MKQVPRCGGSLGGIQDSLSGVTVLQSKLLKGVYIGDYIGGST